MPKGKRPQFWFPSHSAASCHAALGSVPGGSSIARRRRVTHTATASGAANCTTCGNEILRGENEFDTPIDTVPICSGVLAVALPSQSDQRSQREP